MSERHYPPDASIRLAATDGSKRWTLNAPHGSVMFVSAMNEEQAKKLASDEYPDTSPSDFEVAKTCEHGYALRQSCLQCGRNWGEKA